ncbi:MAG: dihydrodipicolinate synthase family protein [Thermomicrobiales bacterium]|nr:dihydrodipicolinate synthase family protein [Thermomicrobiales bacterium]
MANETMLRGCVPILVTPFTDDGAVDLESLKREIDWVIAEGASGVACLAIASEGYKLTEAERDEIIAATVRHVDGRAPVVASADGPGEAPAIDRARRAARLGADALMVLPPYFVKPGPDALVSYYTGIAEAAQIPVMLQDAPQLTGVPMSPALWSRMADASPLIRYVKVEGTPQGEAISETSRRCGDRLGLFCGWGGLSLLDALERGAVGNMPAPNFTRFFADVQRRWESGDRDGAWTLFDEGVPFALWSMQSIDHSVTTAKQELHRRGIIASARVRQPAARLDPIAYAQMARYIDRKIARET